jgi:hypothetical protein
MSAATLDQARAVKQRAFEVCRAQAKVVGVGIARLKDGYAVKVNLEEPPPADASLPDSIDGVPVRFEVVGKVRKR